MSSRHHDSAQDNDQNESTDETLHQGKGRPTPKRREAEARNQRPLIPNDRKEAKARARSEREKARLGMAAGDDRFLPAKEKGPQKRLIRDYVDARWSLGEFMLPVMIIVIVLTFIREPMIVTIYTVGLWVFVAALLIDSFVIGRKARKIAADRFGKDEVEKGLGVYAAMRAIQMRGMRLPKPAVKRGEFDPNRRL
ncbi:MULTISPECIES: DUF3043 domain-containing protein [unclassified Pseudoclavibacter]|uniref:DUF3043 domain-containing protein n=1 Tax=unclassified Pseudoclavibacter TaxID=2615177 RepID=UPI00130182ED|nr:MULTISPECIES: DUF3043 domain-containing protein [unclassified Pseudoclavibacter]KAB1646446.1 DUF3043 domain-containing protein [Pseudoclavibacter sp. CFCC 14310]KAB1663394.1 DUF3043 domain-containing protein [Pseudoclavibacter sp. CFCC 13611]